MLRRAMTITVTGFVRPVIDLTTEEQVARLDPFCDQVVLDDPAAPPGQTLDDVVFHLAPHPGSTLLVWRLDVLGRSTRKLADLLDRMNDHRITLRILDPAITSSDLLQLSDAVTHVADMETLLARGYRQTRGQAAAGAAMIIGAPIGDADRGGRPSVLTDDDIEYGVRLRKEGATWAAIAEELGVSVPTVYRRIRPAINR